VLPLLIALWANLHGGFLIAFPLIGLFLAEAVIKCDQARTVRYSLVLAACLAATLINPYGPAIYYGAYLTLTSTFVHSFVLEWRPVVIGLYMPMTLLLLIILWYNDAADTRIPLHDRLLCMLMPLAALSSIRHTLVAALLLMPAMSLRLSYALQESQWATRARAINTTFLRDMQRNDIRAASAAMAAGALLLLSTPFPRDALLHIPLGFRKDNFPEVEAAYIAKHYPGQHFLNHYNLGGPLDYLWRGKVKLFVDGRASTVFSEDVLRDYSNFMDNNGFGAYAEMMVDRYHIDGLIIPGYTKDAEGWLSNPQWKPVFSGPVAIVYVRRFPDAGKRK
jgi:hypothetical protein